MSVKKILKRSYIYQYYWCLKQYKKSHINIKTTSLIRKVRPYFYNSNDKISQMDKLFSQVKVENCGYGNFFYSIDEESIPFHRYKVIGNMPINYSNIINRSIDELIERNKKICNSISDQNIKTLNIMSRYIDRAITLDSRAKVLESIKYRRALNLEEALQRMLFINQFLWQTGHKLIGLGRIDKLLGSFAEVENEYELISDFMRTLHKHYNFKSSEMLGDTGQIILIGGKDINGSYFYNRFTFIFIRCLMDLRLPDPKILLRVTQNTPDDLFMLAAESISTGIGSPLLSNDDIIIKKLVEFGYSVDDAYNYGVSACWEPLAIGKSLEQNNIASIEFGDAIHKTIEDSAFLSCRNINDVLELLKLHLKSCIYLTLNKIDLIQWEKDPILTLFTEGCLESNKDISIGGAKYNDYGLLSEGMSAAVNSLLNINRFCFDERKYSLLEIQSAILANYLGFEEIEKDFRKNKNGFGEDCSIAIKMTNVIMDITNNELIQYRNRFGGKVKYGLSSPNYIKNGFKVKATADGRKNYMAFSTHISRDDCESPTCIINFASHLEYKGINSNANVIDYMLTPTVVYNNIYKFVILLKSSVKQGIFQIQFNVTSYKQLIDAKNHPEKYSNLIVRVWGFSSYFNDLPNEYKEQLIQRARVMEGLPSLREMI